LSLDAEADVAVEVAMVRENFGALATWKTNKDDVTIPQVDAWWFLQLALVQ
jgi:hypothetical protein